MHSTISTAFPPVRPSFREALSPTLALRMSAFTHNLCSASQRLTVHATVLFVVRRDTAARWVGTFSWAAHSILLFGALDPLIRVTQYTCLMRNREKTTQIEQRVPQSRPSTPP